MSRRIQEQGDGARVKFSLIFHVI